MIRSGIGQSTKAQLMSTNLTDTQSTELTLKEIKQLTANDITGEVARHCLNILKDQCGSPEIRNNYSKTILVYISTIEHELFLLKSKVDEFRSKYGAISP